MSAEEDKRLSSKIGARIKELRDKAGLDDAHLASAMNLSESAIRAMMRGESLANFVKLRRLAEALGVTPNDILGVEPIPAPGQPSPQALFEAIAGAFQSIGRDREESSQLAALVQELANEPLDQPESEPPGFRRQHALLTVRRFLRSIDEKP